MKKYVRLLKLHNVIYNIATEFLMNDFPCANGLSTCKRPFQGKQGMFVIIHQK